MLNSWMARYLTDCAVGLSPATVAIYRYHLAGFVVWLGGRPLSGDLVAGYLVGLRGVKSESTVHGAYRSLRTWFTWLCRRQLLAQNPFDLVRPPPLPAVSRVGLGPVALRRLLVAAADGQHPERDRALLVVFLDTGLRLAELAGLGVVDCDLGSRLLTVQRGKGGRGRRVPVSPAGVAAVAAWLAVRGCPGGSLFGLRRGGVYQVVRRLATRAGVSCSPHQLRHSFATLYTGDVEDLRLILGHQDVSTTAAIYRHRAVSNLVPVHAARSPVSRLLGE